jgi:hypothetical protein
MKKVAVKCAAVGFGVAVALTALDVFAFEVASRGFIIFVLLWPASLSLMMVDRLSKVELAVVVVGLIIHNTFLYGIIGLTGAWVWQLLGSRTKDRVRERGPYGITTIATGFALVGFIAACVLGVVVNYTSSLSPVLYECLVPAPYFPIEPGSHADASVLPLEFVFRGPPNAAIYYGVGLLVGAIWRATHRRPRRRSRLSG